LFVSGHWNEAEEQNRLFMLQERKVDGMIVLTGKLADETLIEMAANIPVVVTGRRLTAKGLFSIDFDNTEGASLAVRHLHALGHNRVAFISGPLDHPDANERLQGFKSEILKKGMSLDEELIVCSDYQEAGGFRAMNSLLDARLQFTAVLAANDQMAYGARLALHRSGLRVPEDISLIGFDDLPHSAFTLPPLTSVRQSVYEIGASAAKAMIDILNKKNPPSRLVAAELVVRESTRINRR
jgi:LacI family transcriptional regulator